MLNEVDTREHSTFNIQHSRRLFLDRGYERIEQGLNAIGHGSGGSEMSRTRNVECRMRRTPVSIQHSTFNIPRLLLDRGYERIEQRPNAIGHGSGGSEMSRTRNV